MHCWQEGVGYAWQGGRRTCRKWSFPQVSEHLSKRNTPYQRNASGVFHDAGVASGGSGVIVLPCGAGKTIVGMACMAAVESSTLILTTNVTPTRQWISELFDKTTLHADQVGEYNGSTKDVRPVTVATYNIMTWRKRRDAE